jgi:hypothetical protein
MSLADLVGCNGKFIADLIETEQNRITKDESLSLAERILIYGFISDTMKFIQIEEPKKMIAFAPMLPRDIKIAILIRKFDTTVLDFIDNLVSMAVGAKNTERMIVAIEETTTEKLERGKPFTRVWQQFQPSIKEQILERLANSIEAIDDIDRRLKSRTD